MQSTAATTAAAATTTADIDLRYSSASALSPPDSSLEDLEEYEDLLVGEEEEDPGMDASGGAVRKPHFLDYDNKPPAGLENQVVFVGQPRRTNESTEAITMVNEEEEEKRKEATAPISQSVVLESESASAVAAAACLKDFGRGTWPSSGPSSSARYGGRQNHSMYNDMSEICPKMECVYSLLSMLGSTNSLEMSAKFMELSKNRDTCSALRRSGCIPLLVQIIHNDSNEIARKNARQALNNVICCHPDDKAGRREVKVLKLIEQLVEYSDMLRDYSEESSPEIREAVEDLEKYPIQSITTLMKISFDEEHRHAMCQLGALQTISTLIELDHAVHGACPSEPKCVTMRRYAGMILTNLTFGDGNNKSLLCSNKSFMRALVAQIQSSSDELVQVTASVLRNLSWRADSVIKQTLSEIGTVKMLTRAAMVCTIENTLKAILSALWNLSNHFPPNKAEFCEVEGALEFLIDMLTYEAPSKTMSVIENAGGILRNISSHVALREDYRKILRKKHCLKILLEQLKSTSLTVVSNACGTLGNLSCDNFVDQMFLRENGAIPMLRSLIYSKHKMISNGSKMALKNLHNQPIVMMGLSSGSSVLSPSMVKSGGSMDAKELPSLNVRKKKALEQELGEKFLPKGLREEKEVCTSRGSPPDEDDEEEVSQSAVHIRLVEEDDDVQEEETEKPVNYSLKEEEPYQDYQETDIDQITDYSIRYAENQSESEEEKGENYRRTNLTNGILMEEDSVKCYYTEGTPQIISSATSMSDLRVQMTTGGVGSGGGGGASEAMAVGSYSKIVVPKSEPIPIASKNLQVLVGGGGGDTGCNTPDKPFNYCVEGTPDYSRGASMNGLDLSGGREPSIPGKPPEAAESSNQTAPPTPGANTKQVSFLNTAEETPLMFSRTSSMGSLSSAEPNCCVDDKSSVVSEFSRLASGIISPSELPDSPTQSMPQSPRRSSMMAQASRPVVAVKKNITLVAPPPPPSAPPVQSKSAFEDSVRKFNVENTPVGFSCATSLSNLSLEDREDEESRQVVGERPPRGPPVLPIPEISEAEAELLLLGAAKTNGMEPRAVPLQPQGQEDSLQRFCTEDTPAVLSEVASECGFSVLSIDSRNGRGSDESSILSDQNDDLLEQCIRSGMPKPKNIDAVNDAMGAVRKAKGLPLVVDGKENPIHMMRNGAAHLVEPLYANDEFRKFYVEDSPCAFSTVSVLSELTVTSEAAARKVNKVSPLAAGEHLELEANGVANPNDANDSLDSIDLPGSNDPHQSSSLLDQCIARGMKKLTINEAVAAPDANDSPDSIDSVDDPQADLLLEQCIARGMKKKPSEQGFEMQTANQTVGNANDTMDSIDSVEGADLMLDQCIARGMKKLTENPREPDPPKLAAGAEQEVIYANQSALQLEKSSKQRATVGVSNDSLSSIDSVDDPQADLMLDQCIARGMKKLLTATNEPQPPREKQEEIYANQSVFQRGGAAFDANDSLDSIESVEDPQAELLLDQCIERGMKKVSEKSVPQIKKATDGNDSSSSIGSEDDPQADLLLDQCIARGMKGTNQNQAQNGEVQQSRDTKPEEDIYANQSAIQQNNRMTSAAVDGNNSLSSIDSVDDPAADLLLEQCIAKGMKKVTEKPSEQAFELRAGMDFNQLAAEVAKARTADANNDSLSSIGSIDDPQADLMLEECIARGMKKLTEKPAEQGFELRAGMNFNPPTFGKQEDIYANQSAIEREKFPQQAINQKASIAAIDANHSFDSSDSNDPQADFLLDQCIARGMKKMTEKSRNLPQASNTPMPTVINRHLAKHTGSNGQMKSRDSQLNRNPPAAFHREQYPLPSSHRMSATAVGANDSISSIDSAVDPQADLLLEQCIQNGMRRLAEKNKRTESLPRRGNRVVSASATDGNDSLSSIESVDDPRADALLEQCIARGMRKLTEKPSGQEFELRAGMDFQRMAINVAQSQSSPKNVDTTPVVTKDVGATNVISAGVVAAVGTADGSSSFSSIITSEQQQQQQQILQTIATGITRSSTTPTNITHTINNHNHHTAAQHISNNIITTTTTTIGSGHRPPRAARAPCPILQASSSITPLVQSGSEDLLERSNEFPAGLMMTSSSAGCSYNNNSSSEMQISNEFMADKHRNPDLMLRSVERLTQELVSTAEYLRTVSSSGGTREEHNTWDDDVTSANDVSFPSLSVQAPRIGHSYDDDDDDSATISEEIDSKSLGILGEQSSPKEEQKFTSKSPTYYQHNNNNNEEPWPTDAINFQLGGEVKHHHLVGGIQRSPPHPSGGLSFSTVSTLTSTTTIAFEATKVANNLQNMAIVESADVDLSQINAPFGADSILISDCSDTEMTFRNEYCKIQLPSGLVAKRALGHTFNDSMNSLNNLDSIGPPSIMDELMDSMISVASITSEVVDVDSGHAGTISAASDQYISSGHSSLTLNSSVENLIKFSPALNMGYVTPGGNSTPMSPKRAERRQAMKDRYKTYTIPNAELIDLNQSIEATMAKDANHKVPNSSDEFKTPTPSVPSTPSPKKSSKERRQENKSRFETQVIDTSILPVANNIPNGDECLRTPVSTIITRPAAFSPFTLQSPAPLSLEPALSPEFVGNGGGGGDDEGDDDPVTYTIQEAQRRKSLEQKLPTISTPPASQNKTSPQSSPSKMPSPAKVTCKINPAPAPQSAQVIKAVRGAKKPAYVSPYRKTVVSAPAVISRTPIPNLAKKEPIAAAAPLTTPKVKSQISQLEAKGRPQPFRARASIDAKRASVEMNGHGSVRSSVGADTPKIRERQQSCGAIGASKLKGNPPTEPSPIIRQGTFTKDEPTNPEVPVVTSAPSTPAKSARKPGSMIPSSASSSRLTSVAKSRLSLQKSISMDASKTTPSTPMAGTPTGDGGTPLSSRYRLTSARTSLVDYKKPNTSGGRLSTPISSNSSNEQIANGITTPTAPGSMIPMRRKSGIVLPKPRTNHTMKSNTSEALKGRLDGVRNAFARTAALKTGAR
ncbi:uncharacterized protein LOC129764380 [Toxorhynchites rutilus septentrionalis]|uniref:uncharacterized protein LOC129764380 n=1 Tax=Toxorhynchites rutilus septentrionalis TaxID=329112 RepID=UPI00247919B4|nr:uncharacterized protein LOC129764380 [Toxorhynchites rutilus septentrionalis]